MTDAKITIIGCGWLGLPLARKLVQTGYKVTGTSTTRANLEKILTTGAQASCCNIGYDDCSMDDSNIFAADYLIVGIPPKRTPDVEDRFFCQIRNLRKYIRSFTQVVFISSTSVYPSNMGLVAESDAVDPEKPSGKALLIAEKYLQQELGKRLTIIRFGGLVGGDRSPASILSRRASLKNLHHRLNLIHRNDCIGIIMDVIHLQVFGTVFNAVADIHPFRYEFYGLPKPHEPNTESTNKIVSNRLIKQVLNYTFQYPNPLEFTYDDTI